MRDIVIGFNSGKKTTIGLTFTVLANIRKMFVV